MRHGRKLSFDEAYEEVVADSMEAILADGYVVQLMADMRAQDKTLWEKVRDWFKDLAQKLQAAVDAFRGVEPDSVEGKLVSEMQDMIVILESFYTDALLDAGENYAARAQKNTAEGGGVKYQARKNGSMDDAEIQAVQGIGEKSIFAFNANDIANTSMLAKRYWNEMGTRSPFFRAWFGDWRGKDTTPIRIATKKGVTKNQPQFNNDTHWVINISGKIFDENKVHHTVSNREAKPYMPYLDEIVQNAVLLDTWGADPKSPNTLLMHSMYAVADIGNGPEVLKLYVEEMNDPAGSKTGKRAYSLQNIEKAFATRKRVQGNSPSSSANVPNAIRTVADLHTAVKIYDKNFTPKPASEVVNADGTPKIVYHGTNAERFSIFSYGHIGSGTGVGVLGDGFYFTDKKNLAKNYGRNVYECYIKMKKPYYATGADAYKLSVNKLKAQGYDGVILGAPAGTVYMVFDNTQIKSATDNIGTFDGTNPDIRYSTRAQTDPKTQHQLEQENESLREDVKYQREMLALQRKVTGGTKFTKPSVLAAARML